MPVPKSEIVETAGRDLVRRDDHLVAVRLAGDRNGTVDHADLPGRAATGGRGGPGVEITQRAVGGALGGEDRTVDHGIACGKMDTRCARREDGDKVVVHGAAGEGLDVIGSIDRRAVVAVVGPWDHDRAHLDVRHPFKLGCHPVDRATRLDVAIEQVAGDQEQIDLLGNGKIHRGGERRELPLALGARLIPEIVMASAEVNICGMDDP